MTSNTLCLLLGLMALSAVNANWIQMDRVNDDTKIHFKIALKYAPDTEQQLLPLFKQITTPGLSMYGNYKTSDEVEQLFKEFGVQDTTDIDKWLDSHQIRIFASNYDNADDDDYSYGTDGVCYYYGNVYNCYAPVKTINNLFRVQFHWFVLNGGGNQRIAKRATTDYHVPEHLRDDIAFVEGVSYLPRADVFKNKHAHVSSPSSIDPNYVAREVVNRLYNVSSNNLKSTKTSLASIEFQASGFDPQSLNASETLNGITPTPVYKVVGENDGGDMESMLDMQMMGMMVEGVQLWYMNYDLWIFSFFSDLATRDEVPYVCSLSYGWAEWDQCTIIVCTNETASQYIQRSNLEAMKVGFRGIMVLTADGDAGSAGRTNEGCESENSTSSGPLDINPVYPGSSPYITSVGATAVLSSSKSNIVIPPFNLRHNQNPNKYTSPLCLKYGCATGNMSQTVNFNQESWTTGGGFAIYSEPQADWQSSVVAEYLNSNVTLPNATQWNPQGRGYPDVTANGHNCPVYDASFGGLQPVDGTSCSSPVFASLMALANDHQTAKGCPRIGFANPLLYLVAQTTTNVFTQPNVTNNHCTEETCCSNDFGFNAPPTPTTWNPISGLGQLNFGMFLAYLDTIKC